MTKKEKETIRQAIKMIHQDDDYYGGMNLLWELIGEKSSDLGKLEHIDIKDIHNGPSGDFNALMTEIFGIKEDDDRPRVGFNYTNKQK